MIPRDTPIRLIQSITHGIPLTRARPFARPSIPHRRINFSISSRARSQQQQQQQQHNHHRSQSYGSRLKYAFNNAKVEWYTIPAALGIGCLGVMQFYKISRREAARTQEDDRASTYANGDDEDPKPKKRPKIRPSGPWLVELRPTLRRLGCTEKIVVADDIVRTGPFKSCLLYRSRHCRDSGVDSTRLTSHTTCAYPDSSYIPSFSA
jgi:hypothetical protein